MIMMINNSTIYYRCLFHCNTGLWRISKPTAEFDGDLFAWSSEGKKFLFQTKNKSVKIILWACGNCYLIFSWTLFKCLSKECFRVNILLHIRHVEYLYFSRNILTWLCNPCFCVNVLLQIRHLNSLVFSCQQFSNVSPRHISLHIF